MRTSVLGWFWYLECTELGLLPAFGLCQEMKYLLPRVMAEQSATEEKTAWRKKIRDKKH